jgi:hypothetical protein
MKTTLLFPHRFKAIGWILFVPSLLLGTLALANDTLLGIRMNVISLFGDNFSSGFLKPMTVDITFTLAGSLVIIGGLLIAFSREKFEDEYVAQLRLVSFQWAVLVNYALLLVAFLAVYGIDFMMVLPYNMFTVMILFVARFHYQLYRTRNLASDEEQA